VPEASSEGTSPLNDRTPARVLKRWGSPRRPRICAPQDGPDPWHRRHDPLRVRLGEEDRDPLVEVFDLLAEAKRQPCLDRDVLGELIEVEVIRPKLKGLCRRHEQCLGVRLAPSPT
jgi:hypothetical protein